MATKRYILVQQYCENTSIEDEFVYKLHEYGIVKFESREQALFLNEKDITEIERNFRLHRDLGINYEGLDALQQMMKRLQKMEKEIKLLNKKLSLFK